MRLFFALLLNACLLAAEKRPITLDDFLQYHSPAAPEIVWSPDGSSFVYEDNGRLQHCQAAKGKCKVWVALDKLAATAKTPSTSPRFNWQNRRVASHQFQWFPNNLDLLASVKGDLFIVHHDGKFDQLTSTELEEEDPKLSPDGAQILYRHAQNLYLLDIASKQVRQLTSDGSATLLNGQLDWVYPEELEIHTASWWSPDSKEIAYLQFDIADEFVYPQAFLLPQRALSEPERYPQAGTPNARVRLGVVSRNGGATTWMKTGDSPDVLLARIAWLPDSSAVALEVLPRLQNSLDLLFANPADGSVKTIVHEDSKDWINVVDNLQFLKSRPEFLWLSERSGFRHVYRYSNAGELLAQLTSGDWQVTGMTAVDEPQHTVYYTSSEQSPLEQHLYRVGLDAAKGVDALQRVRLTTPGFDHEIQSNSDGSFFLDHLSSLSSPPEIVLRDAAGETRMQLKRNEPKQLDDVALLPAEIIQVPAPDGVILYARLIKPAGFEPGKKYPAIVDVYGGPGVQIVRNNWTGIDLDHFLASRGYVVWQLDNRGSSGRGHAFESPIFHNLGKQEVADQVLGLDYLIKMGFVDPDRIGITGWSYGGYMTIRTMLLAPDRFKAGVAGAPVTDWRNYDTIYTERYMGLPAQNLAAYDACSNVANAGRLASKLFIVHNLEDDNVLFQNTVQMANALEEADRPYFMQIYPQKTHGVTGVPRKALYQSLVEFFDGNLKQRGTL